VTRNIKEIKDEIKKFEKILAEIPESSHEWGHVYTILVGLRAELKEALEKEG